MLIERGGYDLLESPSNAYMLTQTHHLKPDDLATLWRELDSTTALPLVAGPDAYQSLDELLHWWREACQDSKRLSAPQAHVYLMWPSRETWGIPVLYQHGFIPQTSLAIRDQNKGSSAQVTTGRDPIVRIATLGDIDIIVSLWLEVVAYDAALGVGSNHPRAPTLLRGAVLALFQRCETWIWLAEVDGNAVGLCIVDLPAFCAGVAPYVRKAQPVYISTLGTQMAHRGTGVGTALIRHVHSALNNAGHRTILLHHALLNPLSAPFWARLDYRPLWTIWRSNRTTATGA
ncbi:GNAT family N-acetyltransferase [Nonomuraea sp. NPDC026600]|uniref:GNAT family N-acetyltransferase n=1 Tax=Nonomuraea sp. NPDC026600 TaxID=3155363 RepID=UPI0033E0AAFE